MKWWLLKLRLRFRLSRKQKQALNGKIPMTKELFWECLDILYKRLEMEKFWGVWHKYPHYIQEWEEKIDRDMEDPDSQLRKEYDEWWAALKPELIEAFGEEWVRENCRE